MPELPEVETTMRGLSPLIGAHITKVVVRCLKLRWPIAADLQEQLVGQTVQTLSRRGKYLLCQLNDCTLIIHLGMSGRLCLHTDNKPVQRHDHVDIWFTNQYVLRYTDPRRFGAILVTQVEPTHHPLLQYLGVEPLTDALTVDYLLQHAKGRRRPIKSLIMDSHIIVGIGNIYAAEALFLAGVHPLLPASELKREQGLCLIDAIKKILDQAIRKGGTTLKDFVNSEGKPGYFSQQLNVYGRAGLPCVICGLPLQSCILGQRSTVFCEHCQCV